jgi:ABC-2 type transport system ATP-binding protein
VLIADAPPAQIKSLASGKKLSFVTDQPLTEADLAGLPHTSLEIDGLRVRMLTQQPETVLRDLFRRGVAISDLEVAGADLEEAFVTLTSHKKAAVPA